MSWKIRAGLAIAAALLIVAVVLLASVNASLAYTRASLHGLATWYADGPGLYAAAGPLLRQGQWRGRLIRVSSGSRSVLVRLTDWCLCGSRHGQPTLLDLSPAAFRALVKTLSHGVIKVEVEVLQP